MSSSFPRRATLLLTACACLFAGLVQTTTAQDEPPPEFQADLSVLKSAAEETAPDADITYAIAIANGGPDAADSATLSDALPAGTTFVSLKQDSGPAFTCSTPAVGDPGSVDCTIAALPAGAQAEFTLVVHTDPGTTPGTTFTNIATASSPTFDPNEENDSGVASSTVPADQADVGITVEGPETALPGSDVAYTIEVTNAGPQAADVTWQDSTPGTATFVSLELESGPGFTCTTPAVGAGGTVTCNASDVAAGATAKYTLVLHFPQDTPSGTVFNNTATVSTTTAQDPNGDNDAATASTTINAADVSAAISGPASATAGDTLTYTLTVANAGPDTATYVNLADVLPEGVTFVSFKQTAGPAFALGKPAQGSGGTVEASRETLASGASATFELVVRIASTMSSGTIENTVTVDAYEADPDTPDNSAKASTSVTGVAPGAPTGLTVTPASPANDNSPRISGTAQEGSTVRVYTSSDCKGDPVAEGPASDFASPGLTVTVPEDSTRTFRATATDADGTSGCSTSSVTYVEDSPPAAPSGLGTTPTSPANDNSPRVTGTAQAGSTVRIYTSSDCKGDPVAEGSASDFASPGLTVSVPDDSTRTFRATATDSGGTSACSTSSVTYVEDSPPAAPSGLSVSPASPANDNSPRISGTAQTGSTVRVYTTSDCSGNPVATGSAADFASPGLTVSVPDDSTRTFRATATDSGGTSACSTSSVTYVEDSPPAAPSGLSVSPASPANDNNPRVRGKAQPGSTVRIYTTSDCSGQPAATGSSADFASTGISVAVPDNSTTTFRATATDGGGTSACSTSSVTYVEDSPPAPPAAPAAPTGLGVSPASPADDNSPRITGTAQAGSTVRVYTTSDCSGEPVATGSAADFASPGLLVTVADDTTTTFRATATDAGGTSACSASVTYEEQSPPAAPSGLAVSPASPADDNSPRISGTAQAGSTVRVYTTSDCSGEPVATGSAADFASPGLTVTVPDDSTTTFRATATDDEGTSPCSTSSVHYEEDSPPAAPSDLGVSPASPGDDTSPRITGTAQPGSVVRVYATADCTGDPAATGSAADFASPGLTVTVPEDSSTTFRATANDGGGTSPCSTSSVTYVEDSAPAAPTGLGVSPASPANDNSPRVTGTAQPGSTVRVYATSDCTGEPAATGSASDFASPGLTVSVPDDSTTTFRATTSDGGGTSPCSTSSVTYEEDSPPAPPTGLAVSPASGANDNSPRITGTAQPGSTVRVYTTSDCTGEPAATGSAADFASPGLTVKVADDSTTTFRATASDGGGTSACSPNAVTYEEKTPRPPVDGGGGGGGGRTEDPPAPPKPPAPPAPPAPNVPSVPPVPTVPAGPWLLERREAPATTLTRRGATRVDTGYVAVCPAGGPDCTGRVTLKVLRRTRSGRVLRFFLHGRAPRRTIPAGTERRIVFTLKPSAARLLREAGSLSTILRGSIRTGTAAPVVRQARLSVAAPD